MSLQELPIEKYLRVMRDRRGEPAATVEKILGGNNGVMDYETLHEKTTSHFNRPLSGAIRTVFPVTFQTREPQDPPRYSYFPMRMTLGGGGIVFLEGKVDR